MSTTSVTLVERPRMSTPVNSVAVTTCPNCGAKTHEEHAYGAQEAQRKIEELEAQIKILTLKATEAVERATDYEDALRQFASAAPSPHPPHIITTAAAHQSSRPGTATSDYPPLPGTAGTPYRPATPNAPPNSRLSRLLPTRRSNVPSLSTAPLHNQPPTSANYPYQYPHTAGLPSTDTETELLSALTREQTLRLAAENAVTQTNEEIEELTGQLFQQANEMVATERKARARLEERVLVLEKRDGEKQKRLELLEMRLARIERVRGMLRDREKEREREKSIEPEAIKQEVEAEENK
ncbi:hypothetical protein MMC26_000922 [Xylographa opegraphella]|nr:hypothetical protein [Xylographa opegraphella]